MAKIFCSVAVGLMLLAAACGGEDNDDGPPQTARPPSAGSNDAAAAAQAPGATPAATNSSDARPSSPSAAPAPDPSAWGTRAQLLVANSEIAVGELNGKIYVIGGYPSTRVVSSAVQVYDTATDRWSTTTPLPVPLHHTMAAGVNGKLYVIGGGLAGPGGTAGSVSVDTVYEYDPGPATWTRKAPMPTVREGGALAVLDGKIYVAGGRPPAGADFAVYDPATDKWTALPNLPTQRNHLAAAAVGGKIYVAGGRFGSGVGSEMTAAHEAYDPRTNTWEKKAPLPAVRAGLNGIAARGCFYTFGGEGNDADPRGIFEQMEVYNPKTDTWTRLAPIPTPVHGVTGAAFVNGLIHLPGGGTLRGGNSGQLLHQVFRAHVSCE